MTLHKHRHKAIRLDKAVVDRGLAPSREKAQGLIMAGRVLVDGVVVSKAGHPTRPDQRIERLEPPHPYVGRGGVKLAYALEALGIEVDGRVALDVGSSTGGFTHCLLLAGAARVYAVDVGRGLLDASLRQDSRVVVREGVNARYLDQTIVPEPVDVVSVDVAFISVSKLLAALVPRLAAGGDLVVLVKPQFELGKGEVGRGVVREPGKHRQAIVGLADHAGAHGLGIHGLVASPIRGARGNREFFLWLRAEPGWKASLLEARAHEVTQS